MISTLSSGVAWTIGARWADRLIGLVSIALLARMLSPADFGLVAMAAVVVAAVEVCFSFGFDWALVRHPDPREEHYSTAWTLRVLFGILAAGAICVAAPLSSQYFREPRLLEVLLVLAVSTLIGSLENPGLAEFRRDLKFRPEFAVRVVAKVAGLVVSIAIAFSFRSYWALPLGSMAACIARVTASYVLHPFRPRMTLAARAELLRFSLWLMLNSFIEFLRSRLADVFIGRQLGPKSLGFFSLGQELATLAVTEIAAPLNRVVFSMYSRQANDRDQLRSSYLATIGVIWIAALPAAAGLAAIAPFIVPLVFGQQWVEAASVVQILSIGTLLSVVGANAQYVFLALNQGRFITTITAVGVGVALGLLIVLVPTYGVLGAAWAYAMSSAVTLPPFILRLCRELGLGTRDFVRAGWRSVVAALAMYASLVSVAPSSSPASVAAEVTITAGLVVLGIAVYTICILLLWIAQGRPSGAEDTLWRVLARAVRRSGADAAGAA